MAPGTKPSGFALKIRAVAWFGLSAVLSTTLIACGTTDGRPPSPGSSVENRLDIETTIPGGLFANRGLENGLTPIEDFTLASKPGSTSLVAVVGEDNRRLGLGLVPVLDVLPVDVQGSRTVVDFQTTALAIYAFQSGIADPLILTLLAALVSDSPELIAASEAIEDALDDSSIDVFSLPPSVLTKVFGISEAARRKSEELSKPSFQGLRKKRQSSLVSVESDCLEDSRVRVQSGICIRSVRELGGGLLEISGYNETPRWVIAKTVGHDGPRRGGFIPPRITQIPDALGLVKDLLLDGGGLTISLLKSGLSALGRRAGLENTWGADDPDIRERVLSRLNEYTGPQEFTLRLLGEESIEVALFAGLGRTGPETDVDDSLVIVADFMTFVQSVILPALTILSGNEPFFAEGKTVYWDAPDNGLQAVGDALLIGSNLVSAFDDLMVGEFADFLGAVPGIMVDIVAVLADPDIQEFAQFLWGISPQELAKSQLENLGRYLAFSPVKVLDTAVGVLNAGSTLWSLVYTRDRIRSTTLVSLGNSPTGSGPLENGDFTLTIPPELQLLVEECASFVNDDFNGNHQPCQEGPWVTRYQTALVEWGVLEPESVNGRYDAEMQRALLYWQIQRRWPNPSTHLSKDEYLGVMVLSILDREGISLTDTCPYWPNADENDVNPLPPNGTGAVLGLCASGGRVEYLQSVLIRDGLLAAETGRFDLDTYQALLEYEQTNRLTVDGQIDMDEFWYIFGD